MSTTTRRLILTVCVLIAAAATASASDPTLGVIRRVDRPIAGSYIIAVRSDATSDIAATAASIAKAHRGQVGFVYDHAFNGFSIRASAARAAAIARDPRVIYVEEDGVAVADTTQTNPTWGLDRIDQRDLPLSGTYTYNQAGTGVTAYVIDTGIRFTHQQFGGRASFGFDAFGGNGDDCNGHGTHVAGTIGGSTYGVAKAVTLVAVRVLNCQGTGSNSGVIAGVDWVVGNHTTGPAVANMSLSSGVDSTVDAAVTNAIADGITFSVSAGNNSTAHRYVSACTRSPARVPTAITVSSTDINDKRSSFANVGTCVDLFGPGSGVLSSWNTSDTATNTISGTSMSTPHVTGTAALYLEANPSAAPSAVASAITSNASAGRVTDPGTGTPNLLLYMGFIGGGGGNNPPTAAFSESCTDLSCSFTDGSTDSDGSVVGWSWAFGDGGTSTTQSPVHAYATSGTYTVTLTVTDNGAATGQTSHAVTVSTGGGGITLSTTGYVVSGIRKVDLTWSGATGSFVDVYRNGVKITTTANDGFHTDSPKAAGTYTYQVCNQGTATCSNDSTVVFS
jgi:PKD repeat protein